MRNRPAGTVADRASLYRQVVLNQVHEDPEVVVLDQDNQDGPDWLDMDLDTSQENWAAAGGLIGSGQRLEDAQIRRKIWIWNASIFSS